MACNLGAGGRGGYGSVIDATETTSHRCATPVASNRGHPRLTGANEASGPNTPLRCLRFLLLSRHVEGDLLVA